MEPLLLLKRLYFVVRRVLAGTRIVHMNRSSLADLPGLAVAEGYELRSYREGDADGWVRVVNAAMNPVWSTKRFLNEVVSVAGFEPENLIVVTSGGQIVGTACALSVGVLHLVAVLPEHRGQGLGKLVTLAALHRLRELGHESAVLITDTSRGPAINLYRRLGFEGEDSELSCPR